MATIAGPTVSHVTLRELPDSGGIGAEDDAQDLTFDRPLTLEFLPPKSPSKNALYRQRVTCTSHTFMGDRNAGGAGPSPSGGSHGDSDLIRF
jgi:hypothetical protein